MSAQQEVIAFLAKPESYGASESPVECIETHGSLIFLHDDRAYKLKRSVAYAALDFRSLRSREQACYAELQLNRRTAPQLYLEVRSINRAADGRLQFNGIGPALDWLVVMRRFPQSAIFENMALCGKLTPDLISRLGIEIARFHASVKITPHFGGAAGIRRAIEDNHQELWCYRTLLDPLILQNLRSDTLAALDSQAEQLELRRQHGLVRQCHGDLRLANICVDDGQPTLFDGIEFSEELSCIDVLYDLAFVLMDLRHHHLNELAAQLMDSYLGHSKLTFDYKVLPLLLSVRAATRCYTLAASADRQSNLTAKQHKHKQALALLAQARNYLNSDNVKVPCIMQPT